MPTRYLVIVGGGFGGVYAARALQKRLPDGYEIILFSQENHFIFTPLLGDVVGSSINPMHVVWPIRQMAPRVTCRTAALTRIDLEGREVEYHTSAGQFARQPYEHLILACGSVVNLDIIPGMAAHGWPCKTMGDALLLRNHLIGLLEKAEVEPDPAVRKRLLSVAVVGGGFSGVEVAGEAMDLLKESIRFYRTLQPSDVKVTLLQGAARILPELPEKLSTFAAAKMRRRGIDIRTGAKAQSVTEHHIHLGDGASLETATVICTIGTTANPLIQALGLPMAGNRLKAEPDFRIAGQERLWALADCAAVPNGYDGKPCAPTAQLAVRQGRQLADNLLRVLKGLGTKPFYFKPVGMLASIGNYNGVGLVFGLRVSGLLGWFLWRGIYLGKMPTLARKIQIAFDWAWQLIFPRDIAQMQLGATERFGRAHFEPGQYVFHKGDPGDRFFVVEQGRAAVLLDETSVPVAQLRAGDHFGEGALLHSARRSASVRAEEPLDLLVVNQHSFGQLTKHLGILRRALERADQSHRSAAAWLEQLRTDPKLETTPVAAAMAHPIATLPVALTFEQALKLAQSLAKGAYPVVDEAGVMVGLCTRTDFYRALQKPCPPDTPLRDIMNQRVLTVKTTDTLGTALLTFVREPIKRLVVVDADDARRPVGMLTPFDIVRRVDQ